MGEDRERVSVGVVFKRDEQAICRAGAKRGRYWPMGGRTGGKGGMGKWSKMNLRGT